METRELETRECDSFELEIRFDNSIKAVWTACNDSSEPEPAESKIDDDLYLREDIERRLKYLR
ncbi:MAG: hypothetical protein WCA35_24410, partial [Kovacikia sp.]